ncbi:partner of xrn-2 protein 1 [Galendromus occidentalis]|uniref:Partner of xrn-2 protein 1 n=1 Tax=Galendromus occidentalis TaxID=34638 RepID=A0AAJ6VXT5_9ACAR|nr:partner of xrn-2 protein 1 [Galendromus occidentalis]
MPLSQEIETYRQPWESAENWELREEFLLQYQDNYEENRLLCLAQAYVNVLLLGCNYPDDVMRQVSEMAKGLEKGQALRETKEEEKKKRKTENAAKKARTEELGSRIGRPQYNRGYHGNYH